MSSERRTLLAISVAAFLATFRDIRKFGVDERGRSPGVAISSVIVRVAVSLVRRYRGGGLRKGELFGDCVNGARAIIGAPFAGPIYPR